MPPSLGQQNDGGDLLELHSSRIAEFAWRLEHAATSTGAEQSIRFPGHLTEVLLRTAVPVDSSNLSNIISTLDHYKERLNQKLHTDSVRCLAYLLLSSSASSEKERGLHLLLDRSEYVDGSPASPPAPTKQSALARRKLAETLCSRFLDESWKIGLRRLAGKLLLEIFLELEETGSLLDPEQMEYPYHKFVAAFCGQTDIVLRFFAGSILRALCLSGISKDTLWVHDNSEFRPTFFNCLRNSPDDWAQAFHSYIREIGRRPSVGPGRSGNDAATENSTEVPCYSVTSIRTDTKSYHDGFMLAITTGDTLALLLPGRKTSQQYFHLIEAPLVHISDRITDAVDIIERQKFRLQLYIVANGAVLKNGKRQESQNPFICLVSDEDLTNLWIRIRSIETENQEHVAKKRFVPRRHSSILIPLDTGEEVAEKSVQYEITPDVTANDDAHTADKSNIHATFEHVYHQLGHMKVATPPREDKMRSRQVTSYAPDLPQRATQTQGGTGSTPHAAVSSAVTERTRNRETLETELKDSKIAKAVMGKSSQNGQKGSKASNAKKKSALPAVTQEPPQLPRPQRAKRKVYTSNDEVDWDEDLRPTDDSETQDQKDAEYTSVSTPSPSDSPVLDRRSTVRKKRKIGPPKTGDTRKHTKKNNAKTGNRKAKHKPESRKLTLLPRGSSADNENQNAMPVQPAKGRPNIDKENIQDITYDGDGNDGVKKVVTSLQCTAHSITSNPGSVSPRRSEGTFISAETDGGDSDASGNLDLLSDISVFPENLWDSSAPWLTPANGNGSDDAQSYQEGNGLGWEVHPPKKTRGMRQQGRGGVLGNKLSAALLEANVLPDALPPREDRSSSHQDPAVRSNQYKHFEVFSPPEGVRSLTPRADQQRRPADSARDAKQQSKLKKREKDRKFDTSAADKVSKENLLDEQLTTIEVTPEIHDVHAFEKSKASLNAINPKRVASDEPMDEPPYKIHSTGPEPEHELVPETKTCTSQLPQTNIQPADEVDTFGKKDTDIESSSWVTTEDGDNTVDAENTQLELHLHPRLASSRYSTASGPPRTPTQRRYVAGDPKPFRKTIVDMNGSPRLRPRQSPLVEDKGQWHGQNSMLAGQVEQGMERLVRDSDSDNADNYPINTPIFGSRVRLYFGKALAGTPRRLTVSDTDSEVSTSRISVEQPRGEGIRAVLAESVQGDTPIAVSTPPSQSDAAEMGIDHGAEEHALEPSQSPVQLESELAKLDTEGDDLAAKWQTCLQTIQQTTDNVLTNTSKNLLHHVEREQQAISRVLELYLEGCHRVLDRLAKAQDERIEAYRQQMNTIKAHQAGLCRDLVRRLEGLGGPTSDGGRDG